MICSVLFHISLSKIFVRDFKKSINTSIPILNRLDRAIVFSITFTKLYKITKYCNTDSKLISDPGKRYITSRLLKINTGEII